MNVIWQNVQRKNVRILLSRKSSEQIIDEWKSLIEGNGLKRSIYVRKLVMLIKKQLTKPERKTEAYFNFKG